MTKWETYFIPFTPFTLKYLTTYFLKIKTVSYTTISIVTNIKSLTFVQDYSLIHMQVSSTVAVMFFVGIFRIVCIGLSKSFGFYKLECFLSIYFAF